MSDGRRFVSAIEAAVNRLGDGVLEIRSPAVGLWRSGPRPGSVVAPGDSIGELEILGKLHRLIAPSAASGVVGASADTRGQGYSRRPVEYGQVLFTLDPSAAGVAALAADDDGRADLADGALVFRAPTSGRFYSRPGPKAAPFVTPGALLERGNPICLLEIMKTFNRVTYGGADLPASARVVAVIPADESDLNAGDPILELEPV